MSVVASICINSLQNHYTTHLTFINPTSGFALSAPAFIFLTVEDDSNTYLSLLTLNIWIIVNLNTINANSLTELNYGGILILTL